MSEALRRWQVEVRRAGQAPASYRIAAGEALEVGRDPDCDLVLDSPDVSRRHLRVTAQGTGLGIEDRSVNGSKLGGRWLRGDHALAAYGAAVCLGPYELCIHHSELPGAEGFAGLGDGVLEGASAGATSPTNSSDSTDSITAAPELRRRARDLLLERLELSRIDPSALGAAEMRPRVEDALRRIWRELMPGDAPSGALERWILELADEALGLGPLEPLLTDPAVSEIMVVDPQTVYVERAGELVLSDACFTDALAVRTAIERIVTPLGRRIDESSPMVDARLPDGSRVHAIIPPLALRGPCITIRRFPADRFNLQDLQGAGAMSEQMASFLRRCVAARKNILISGGTGTGKTTLLNVLSAFIGERERVVTIEDAAELCLEQRHVVPLESRPAGAEGNGAVEIRDLVRTALRMRPDRIVVGECRAGEALDMLQAMNTGHDGSMSTTHANTPEQACQRLETLCMMGDVGMPVAAIRRQIAASIDLIVQLQRASDGRRRISHIAEVVGLDSGSGEVRVRDVYVFHARGTDADADGRPRGTFRPTGYLPSFIDSLVQPARAVGEDRQ